MIYWGLKVSSFFSFLPHYPTLSPLTLTFPILSRLQPTLFPVTLSYHTLPHPTLAWPRPAPPLPAPQRPQQTRGREAKDGESGERTPEERVMGGVRTRLREIPGNQ